MTTSFPSQTEPAHSVKMRAAKGLNGLTFWTNTVTSCLTGGVGTLLLLGGASLSGTALLVGTAVQNLLARDANRARDDIEDAVLEGNITATQSTKALMNGLARTIFTPLLVAFSLSAAIPPFLVDMSVLDQKREQQNTLKTENGGRQRSSRIPVPEKNLAPARPLTLS